MPKMFLGGSRISARSHTCSPSPWALWPRRSPKCQHPGARHEVPLAQVTQGCKGVKQEKLWIFFTVHQVSIILDNMPNEGTSLQTFGFKTWQNSPLHEFDVQIHCVGLTGFCCFNSWNGRNRHHWNWNPLISPRCCNCFRLQEASQINGGNFPWCRLLGRPCYAKRCWTLLRQSPPWPSCDQPGRHSEVIMSKATS